MARHIFLRLGAWCTLIRHESGATKRSSNRRNLKTPPLHVFSCGPGKRFQNGAFRKRRGYYNHNIELPLKYRSKITGDCCIFLIQPPCSHEKHLVRFQSETSVFKFPRLGVVGAPGRGLKSWGTYFAISINAAINAVWSWKGTLSRLLWTFIWTWAWVQCGQSFL